MIIKSLITGMYGANCYILIDETSRETVVIDPGTDAQKVHEIVASENGKLKYILLTHGHFDHTTDVEKLLNMYNYDVKVAIGKEDNEMILKKVQYFGPFPEGGADVLLNDGDEIKFGNNTVKCIHTPGHTPGGMCFLVGERLFSGDTLFYRSVGRTDFQGGSYEAIISSVKNKLMILPDETVVYCGHGQKTTIGTERVLNPFL